MIKIVSNYYEFSYPLYVLNVCMRGVDVSLQLVRLINPACFTHLNHQNIVREAVHNKSQPSQLVTCNEHSNKLPRYLEYRFQHSTSGTRDCRIIPPTRILFQQSITSKICKCVFLKIAKRTPGRRLLPDLVVMELPLKTAV